MAESCFADCLHRRRDSVLGNGAGPSQTGVIGVIRAKSPDRDDAGPHFMGPSLLSHRLGGNRLAPGQGIAQSRYSPSGRRYGTETTNNNVPGTSLGGDLRIAGVHYNHLLKIKLAFAPPNPKELLSTYCRLPSAGSLTIGNAQAGSGVCKVEVGGNHWPRSAITQATASTAPAAPNKWPTLDLVELTGKLLALAPAQRLMAAASAISFSGVPVPWAFK
jgi:hypothetical protein